MTDESTYEDQFDWNDATSGGLLSEYVGTITSGEFGVDEDYNDETVRAMFDIELVSHDDPDVDLEPGDVLHEAFNAGKTSTWEASADGRTISRVDGKRPRFASQGGYGRLIEMVMPGKKDSMEGADKLIEVIRERGPATNIDIWKGLTFRFKRLPFSFTNSDNELVEYERTYPVEFLGEGDASGTGTGTTASKGKAETAATPAASDNKPTRADLIALAAEHEQFAAFLAAAMKQYPGVEDGEFAEDVMSKDGVFSEAHS